MPMIDINPDERVLVVGTSGSGKTFLVWNILIPRYAIRPVVFDPKERLEPWDETWEIVPHFNPEIEKQIVRIPEYEEKYGPDLWDAEVAKILRDGNRTLIIDELTLCTRPREFPRSLGRAIRTGRDYKHGSVGVWMICQRCANIPTSAYSESRHIYSFSLTREDDRERLSRETHPLMVELLDELDWHDYVHYDTRKKVFHFVYSAGCGGR